MIAVATILQVLAGMVLIESRCFGWSKVPFACGHAPSPDVLKAWWPIYAVALYVYAFKLSDWQFAGADGAAGADASISRRLRPALIVLRIDALAADRRQSLEFDAVQPGHRGALNLSGALN